jgi:nucleoside-diphosphate-sugar epimerase
MIAVTGGLGFVGAHTVRALVSSRSVHKVSALAASGGQWWLKTSR